jgi:hypothetical protein
MPHCEKMNFFLEILEGKGTREETTNNKGIFLSFLLLKGNKNVQLP